MQLFKKGINRRIYILRLSKNKSNNLINAIILHFTIKNNSFLIFKFKYNNDNNFIDASILLFTQSI